MGERSATHHFCSQNGLWLEIWRTTYPELEAMGNASLTHPTLTNFARRKESAYAIGVFSGKSTNMVQIPIRAPDDPAAMAEEIHEL